MLVLFDIDDTLIDHSAAVRDGVSELFGRIQSPLRLEEFLASWVVAMKEHYPRYLSGAVTYEDQRRARIRQTVGPQLSDQQADELFAIYFQTYAASWAVFPDVLPCLDALEDHRLGIISNGQGAEQRSKLQLTGIVDRFEFIHISAEAGARSRRRQSSIMLVKWPERRRERLSTWAISTTSMR